MQALKERSEITSTSLDTLLATALQPKEGSLIRMVDAASRERTKSRRPHEEHRERCASGYC